MKKITRVISAFIVLISLSACIENPGPDSHLRQEKRHLFEKDASIEYHGQPVFNLELITSYSWLGEPDQSAWLQGVGENGTIDDPGLYADDSITFLLQACDGETQSGPPILCSATPFERLVRGRVPHKGTYVDFESTVIAHPYEFSHQVLVATLLNLYHGINELSHPLGGIYKGSYFGRDNLPSTDSGSVKGIINADGGFTFQFKKITDRSFDGEITGKIGADGAVQEILTSHIPVTDSQPSVNAKFTPLGKDLGITFRFSNPEGRFLDSLIIDLVPYTPPNPPAHID